MVDRVNVMQSPSDLRDQNRESHGRKATLRGRPTNRELGDRRWRLCRLQDLAAGLTSHVEELAVGRQGDPSGSFLTGYNMFNLPTGCIEDAGGGHISLR